METWKRVWRDGFVPILSTKNLEDLKAALESDDPHLIQGATCSPPPLMCLQDWPVEAGCLMGYCGAMDNGGFSTVVNGVETNPGAAKVAHVEEFFAKKCFDADQRLGDPAACRWILNWFDETPRDEMRRELLTEVELALKERSL